MGFETPIETVKPNGGTDPPKEGGILGDLDEKDDIVDVPGDILFIDPFTGILLNFWLPAVALRLLVARTFNLGGLGRPLISFQITSFCRGANTVFFPIFGRILLRFNWSLGSSSRRKGDVRLQQVTEIYNLLILSSYSGKWQFLLRAYLQNSLFFFKRSTLEIELNHPLCS